MTIENGQMAPLFSLVSDEGAEVNLAELKGKYVVLYFYPKDCLLYTSDAADE